MRAHRRFSSGVTCFCGTIYFGLAIALIQTMVKHASVVFEPVARFLRLMTAVETKATANQ
jgi:hypothetical protein